MLISFPLPCFCDRQSEFCPFIGNLRVDVKNLVHQFLTGCVAVLIAAAADAARGNRVERIVHIDEITGLSPVAATAISGRKA